jgi:superfamily II DNA/RNA helicase
MSSLLCLQEAIVLRCRMSAMQGAVYDWIKSTGTIRVDPEDESRKAQKNPMYQPKSYKTLNNKCMELRKVCNHPLLNYPSTAYFTKDFVVRSCGKLWVLDRILVKMHQAGHRVLLFSTMTKLLDIMEEYLQWRRLLYRRIDGTTSLEEREAAIVDFNAPDSDCFIFLLSIRAAGRGLNLQSADTVVIYDPDPNPQNEEQAVARAHRIGQTREVKVIYLEAVVDKISSYQKEDDLRAGGSGTDFEDDLIGKDRYMGSIESLIRSNIQQYKIDMADEVINAGRFDQRTTHEERRMTLETLLHDEERYQETVHDVPSLQQVNRMIARSEEEVELFDQMDEEYDWPGDMVRHNQVPKWLRTSTTEVDAVVASLSKKPWRNAQIDLENNNNGESSSARRRGRPVYREIDESEDEIEESEEERDTNIAPEDEGEIRESEDEEEDEEEDGSVPSNKNLPEEGEDEEEEEEEDTGPNNGNNAAGDYYYKDALDGGDGTRDNDAKYVEETGGMSTGSSSGGSQRLQLPTTPSESSQKFGSLSALEARPGSISKRSVCIR